MGGCGIQNNIAQCYCPYYYTGYYCQFRMLKSKIWYIFTLKVIVGYNSRTLGSKACNKTCLNGGRCYMDGEQARCSCPNEYYGSRCEHSQSFFFKLFTVSINDSF
jgi:hypothetical protein